MTFVLLSFVLSDLMDNTMYNFTVGSAISEGAVVTYATTSQFAVPLCPSECTHYVRLIIEHQ